MVKLRFRCSEGVNDVSLSVRIMISNMSYIIVRLTFVLRLIFLNGSTADEDTSLVSPKSVMTQCDVIVVKAGVVEF